MLLYCMYFIGYPVVNDPLYNHEVFGPEKGKYGNIGKTDEQLIQDLISIHNAENWLGMDIESEGGNVLSAGVQESMTGFLLITIRHKALRRVVQLRARLI